MPSFPISGLTETEVDEEDAWRLKEAHYNLKNVPRVDGTVRQYAYHDVIQLSPDGLIARFIYGYGPNFPDQPQPIHIVERVKLILGKKELLGRIR